MAEENKKPLPLPEIITGVLIVIILIVFALPRYMDWNEKGMVGNEASTLYYALVKAKNKAVDIQHRVWVKFEGTSGYSILEDLNDNGVADSDEPFHKVKLTPGIQFGVSLEPPLENVWGTGTVTLPVDLEDGATELYFDPKGKANRAGAVYFINTVDLGNTNANVRAIKILGATGAISMVKSAPGKSPPWE